MKEPQAVKKDFSKEEQEYQELREQAVKESAPPEDSAEASLPSEQDVPSEPEAPPQPEPAQPKVLDVPSEQKSEPDKEPSPRAQERYHELARRRKDAEDRAAQLEAERNSLLQVLQKQPSVLNNDEPVELTTDQYEADVMRKAQQVTDERIRLFQANQERLQAHEKFLEDLNYVETTYSVLNTKSGDYDRDFDELIGEHYQAVLASNPKARLKDVVKKFIDLREKSLEQAKREKIASVAKQASQQAVSPTGGPVSTSNAKDLIRKIEAADSIAELEALKAQL